MSNQKLDIILNKLVAMENELKGITGEVSNINTKIDVVTEQVAKNAEDVTDIKDVVHHISNIQSKQEDTINILARRSIDQEEAIKSK